MTGPSPLSPTPQHPLVVQGRSEQITYDGAWVTIQDPGQPSRPGDRRAPIEDITDVEIKAARFGGRQVRIEYARGSDRPSLTVAFKGNQQESLAVLVAAINAARDAIHSPRPPVSPAPADAGDELRRLWQLVQRGEISREQFEDAKGRLFR
ncbi:SHOCT domain-containing protein [Cryptosporangium phraense]|uniref:SHOCT domain-containing protein n=1 Tax=Cryptosporangium phraense TaxID=2593070 RepID=A0A545ATT9_9ACTN|nr:SHOCT domain-containing protein [Cryptosporangium phraense]TQS44015.1 SHOCT domain-containing protein [Cryptosporangium phraense]